MLPLGRCSRISDSAERSPKGRCNTTSLAPWPSVLEVLRPFFGEYGFLNPVLAAAAMALSSVTVLSNALRLRRVKV